MFYRHRALSYSSRTILDAPWTYLEYHGVKNVLSLSLTLLFLSPSSHMSQHAVFLYLDQVPINCRCLFPWYQFLIQTEFCKFFDCAFDPRTLLSEVWKRTTRNLLLIKKVTHFLATRKIFLVLLLPHRNGGIQHILNFWLYSRLEYSRYQDRPSMVQKI